MTKRIMNKQFTPAQEKAWQAWSGEVMKHCYAAGMTTKQVFGAFKACPDIRDDEFPRGVAPDACARSIIDLRHLLGTGPWPHTTTSSTHSLPSGCGT